MSSLPKHLLPFPSNYTFKVRSPSQEWIAQRLNSVFRPLDLRWQFRPSLATGIGVASGNVWSRSARRKPNKTENGDFSREKDKEEEEGEQPAVGFKIHVLPIANQETEVHVRWLQGEDSVLFESFCGMLKRSVTT